MSTALAPVDNATLCHHGADDRQGLGVHRGDLYPIESRSLER
jgi:hypothetical protein